jgi:deoxyribonuclease-4
LRIGIHTSKAGSLENAANKAYELGANCFQIFSSSPRAWRASKPDPVQIRNFRAIREKHDLRPLAIHDSYLINLASCEDAIRRSSIAAFRGEIERALAIGAEYLVMHPGNCKGQPMEQGLANVVEGLVEATMGLTGGLTILLENTVGAGGQIGGRFEELEVIRQFAQNRVELPIGFCLDTCHCYASGNYNVATPEGLNSTVRQIEAILGLERVPVMHANDSKGEAGSRLDRHAHIGEGRIGPMVSGAFSRIRNSNPRPSFWRHPSTIRAMTNATWTRCGRYAESPPPNGRCDTFGAYVKQNLDTLKSEIATALRESGMVIFHGMSRALDKTPEVEWDTERYPDYQQFIEIAKQLGVRMMVLHHHEFDADILDRAVEELEGTEMPYEEQRQYEKRLAELKIYDGFTCSIELSFDHNGLTYFFELHTDWFDEVNSILQELDLAPLTEDEEDDESYGGYYSKN